MKKMIYFTIILLLSCQSNNKLTNKNIENPSLNYNDTSAYKIIPLETNQESIFGSNDKTVMNDSVIAILDNEQKKIFIFDTDGSFRSKINNIGNSNNEYISIGDFLIYKDTIYLLDYTKKKVLKYNYNGDYIDNDVMIDYVGMAFTKTDDENYIFYQHFEKAETDNSEIIKTDINGNTKFSYIKRETDRIYPVSNRNYFSNNSKGTFFIPINQDKIYKLTSDNKLNEVFDFGIKNNMRTNNDPENKGLYSYFFDFHVCNNGMFVCSNSENDKLFDLFGNMNTGQYTMSNDLIVRTSYGDCFVTTIRDYSKFKKKEETKYDIYADSNPAIVLINSNSILF